MVFKGIRIAAPLASLAVVACVTGCSGGYFLATTALFGAPTQLAAAPGNAQVVLSWTTPTSTSAPESYNIYYSTSAGVAPATGTRISGVTTTSYTQSSLTNGTTYYYVVTAVYGAGESGPSNQVSATPSVPVVIPTAPTNLAAMAGNAQVSFTWTASAGATSYNLYWSTTTGVTPANGTKISGISSSSYTQTDLTNGTAYYYVVTAVDSAGESSPSSQVAATPVAPVTAPSAPTNLAAAAGNAQVSLTWTASAGATSYNLYWSTSSGVTPANGTKISGIANPAYVQASLTNGTTYYYAVTAVNSGGESPASSHAMATPVAPVTIALAPTNLAAAAGNAQVSLTWTASAGATSYNLYWSTTAGVMPANGTRISGITNPAYLQTGLTNGATYYYVVTAVNSAGESDPSNQAISTPIAPISAAPLNLAGTAGNAQVALSWSASAGAATYNLYWSTTSGVTPANGTKISGITNPAYVQNGLTNGTTYFYVVTAVNTGGESPASNQASATPVAAIPAAPLNLNASAGAAQALLSWSVSSGATSYNLYYSTTAGVSPANGTKISGITATNYTQSGLISGTTYYYVVTAVNASGESSASNQASATPAVPNVTVMGSVLLDGVPRSMAAYTNGSQQLIYACSDSQINIVDVTNASSPKLLSTFANSVLTESGATPGFQVISCSIDGTYLIISFSREDGNTTADPTAIPTHFATFNLANPLNPTQVGSTISIDRPDSSGLYVQGTFAFMVQTTELYDQFSGFLTQETGDVWAVDLTNALTSGNYAFLSDLYPCGGINSSTSACNNSTPVTTATFIGTVCTVNGTTPVPNDQYEGGPYELYPGAIVNGTTAYFASTSATFGNVENPACPPIQGQLLVVNSSNPSDLAITTSVPVPQAAFLTWVAVQGNVALAVGDNTGVFSINSGFVGNLVLASFDISNPQSPVLLDTVVTPLTDQGGATIVAIGNDAFAVGGTAENGSPALLQIDASNPTALTYQVYGSPVVASPEIGIPPNVYALSATPISTVNELSIFQFVP